MMKGKGRRFKLITESLSRGWINFLPQRIGALPRSDPRSTKSSRAENHGRRTITVGPTPLAIAIPPPNAAMGFHEKQTLTTYYGSDYLDADKIDDNICQLQKQYIHKMADLCANHLQSCSSISDLGGGTGYFTRLMLQQMQPPPEHCACVDPYLAKDDEMEGGIHFLKIDAVEYLEKLDTDTKVDGFLLKEMLHHIPDQSRLFQNLARIFQQNGGGKALIVTRPDNPHLVWFPRIAEVFKESCVDIESARESAEKAGLTWTQTLHDFPLEFTVDEWSKLLRSRFWSIFKEFSDEELEEGIEFMRKQNSDKSVLHFPDRYWLIDITLK